MTASSYSVFEPRELEFVRSLAAAREVQAVDRGRRIDALDAERERRILEFPDRDALVPILRQV